MSRGRDEPSEQQRIGGVAGADAGQKYAEAGCANLEPLASEYDEQAACGAGRQRGEDMDDGESGQHARAADGGEPLPDSCPAADGDRRRAPGDGEAAQHERGDDVGRGVHTEGDTDAGPRDERPREESEQDLRDDGDGPQGLPNDTGLQLFGNAAAAAAGLVALTLAFGPVSGAHFNPVVSLADAFFGNLDRRDLPAYIAAQMASAVTGSIVANLMFELDAVSCSTRARWRPGSGGGELAEAQPPPRLCHVGAS